MAPSSDHVAGTSPAGSLPAAPADAPGTRSRPSGERLITGSDKGLPARAIGSTVRSFLATAPRISEFATPLLVLNDALLGHNIATMAAWAGSRGFSLMPHGKTSMAPALWQRQLAAGAFGITIATVGQARTAWDFGIPRVMIASSVVDPASLRWLAEHRGRGPSALMTWADSVETVDVMDEGLAAGPAEERLDVLVELGALGGRTGARTLQEARAVAERVVASSHLRLAGVAGYEGALAHDRSAAGLEAVRAYVTSVSRLHQDLRDLYDDHEVVVTLGGSAYFDLVTEVKDPSSADDGGHTRYVLRSGAYVTHDDGFYAGISPLGRSRRPGDEGLASAMRGRARVISHPEPDLVLLDAGKRDLPFDEGLPVPLGLWSSADAGSPTLRALAGASVSAMNDQHTFLRLGEQAAAVRLGDVVELGLSHPCTAFDKWRLIPVVASWEPDARVVDLLETYF